ncbi:hypothetical protein PVAP13_3NG092900 [Panicum virgatum]|uniref:F-box domain-containing protein n=1 Tax=Panicum virgatum TaxID=38727 RepID=A0A8T0UH33_PANVG|nr:hypothetical protein PVAP13_3NG092900 [Panicum virgatum]
MAPAGPRSPARKRIKTAPGVTLPPDMLFEVFLNLPASSVCRFRAVCRSCPRSWHVDLVDLAGTVARRTRTPEAEGGAKELLTCGDLACLVGADDGIARVLDPATGAVTVLPHGLSEENKVAEGWGRRESFHVVAYAFGRVSSTGEYKLLRLVRLLRYTPARGGGLLAEVLTLDGDARWRSRRSPPVIVAADSMVVVDGIVYFLAAQIEQLPFFVNNRVSGQPGSIASFNLETEEWMPIIRGSLNGRQPPLLTLAELNGFLVTVHSDRHQLFIHGSMVSDGLQTGNLGEKIQHSA